MGMPINRWRNAWIRLLFPGFWGLGCISWITGICSFLCRGLFPKKNKNEEERAKKMKNSGNSGDFPWNFTDGASSEAHPGIQHIRESRLLFIPAWNSRHRDPPRISRGRSRRTHGAAGMRTGFPGEPDRGHSQIFFFSPNSG